MKKILPTLLLSATLLCGTANAQSFSDVSADQWYYSAVTQAAQDGYISGYENGSFKPDQALTGAEWAVILANALYPDQLAQEQTRAEHPYWYSPFVNSLRAYAQDDSAAHSINFQNTITRAQAASLILDGMYMHKLSMLIHEDQWEDILNEYFTDWSDFQGYISAVANVLNYSFMSGINANSFGGDQSLTRAQAAVIIVNMMNSRNFVEPFDTVDYEPPVEVDPMTYYQPILNNISDIVLGYVDGFEEPYSEYSNTFRYFTNTPEKIGYTLHDFDGDGQMELVIGDDSDYNSGFMMAFGYHNGVVSPLVVAHERERAHFDGKASFWMHGSFSAWAGDMYEVTIQNSQAVYTSPYYLYEGHTDGGVTWLAYEWDGDDILWGQPRVTTEAETIPYQEDINLEISYFTYTPFIQAPQLPSIDEAAAKVIAQNWLNYSYTGYFALNDYTSIGYTTNSDGSKQPYYTVSITENGIIEYFAVHGDTGALYYLDVGRNLIPVDTWAEQGFPKG